MASVFRTARRRQALGRGGRPAAPLRQTLGSSVAAFLAIRSCARARRSAVLSLLLLGLGGRAVDAHPHVWIDADVALRFKDKRIEALEITWLFDEFFSQTAIEDFGKRHRGKLDETELKGLVAQSSESLKHYSYFTYLQVGDARRRVGAVDDFTAEMKGKRLAYHFVVPVTPAIDPKQQSFGFLLYDETYYVYVAIAEGHKVTYTGDVPEACTESRKVDKTTPLYFGFDYPTMISISCP